MILKIEENKFITNRNERYLFKSVGVDLEQKTPQELMVISQKIKSELNLLKSNEYFKFYFLKEGIFFDSPNKENFFPSLNPTPTNTGLSPFLGMDNFYSYPEFAEDYIKLNGKYFRFISIIPDEGTVLDFGELGKYGDYFIIFRKIETKNSKLMVDQARKINHGSLYNMLSDIEGIEAYRENEEMLRKIITNEEGLFKVDIHYTLREVSEVALFDKTATLLESLSIRGLGPKISTYALNSDFINFTVGMVTGLTKELVFHSSLLLNCLPIHQDHVHSEGVPFSAKSGNPVYLFTKTMFIVKVFHFLQNLEILST